MLKMDLIPEEEGVKNKKRLRNISAAVLVFILLLFGGIYFGLSFSQNKSAVKLSEAEAETEKLKQEIKASQDALAEAFVAQKQLDNLDRLLNCRMYWTEFFKTLGATTIPDVFFTDFQSNIDTREVSLPAYTKNYQSLARQLKAWEQAEIIQAVNVGSASLNVSKDQAVISFQAELTFKEEAWQH